MVGNNFWLSDTIYFMNTFPENFLLDRTYSFEKIAEQYPNHIALMHSDGALLRYRELHEKSNQLAQFFIAQGVAANDIVAICLENVFDRIVAIIALQKIGAAYMPIDAAFPAERIAYMLADGKPKGVLTEPSYLPLFPQQQTWLLAAQRELIQSYDPAWVAPSHNGNYSYVLFTSGSTGKPKGVLMNRTASDNLIAWQIQDSSMGVGSKTLHFSPLTFDVSFQEIFATLATGGTLCTINKEMKLDAEGLLQYIAATDINRIFLPFVALQAICDMATTVSLYPSQLKEIITAGEQLKISSSVREFFTQLPHARLINQYGPTEAHVVTSLTLQGTPNEWAELPSIGTPITGAHIYLLDENNQEVATNTPAALFIGGVVLAKEYIHQPKLTAEKFISYTPTGANSIRLYKTGDLAKRLPDGTIEFLGRMDEQVKISGYRIELGEIENCLLQYEGIAQAVVNVYRKNTQHPQLVAYLVARKAEKDTTLIKAYLKRFLPEYMIPSLLVWLDEIPKTASGKIDRKALPEPTANTITSQAYVAPVSATEKLLARLWTDVLGIDPIGVNDNFFEIGGSSLSVLKVTTLLRKKEVKIAAVKLYQYPTIRTLAAHIDGKTVVKKNAKVLKGDSDEVAVIGMAGRFPGAETIQEFWKLLVEGKETIHFFEENELDETIPEAIIKQPTYVKARGILKNVKTFDASFFGINPNHARLMDPQQRIFLEVAWEALESCGYANNKHDATIGVFAAVNSNTYFVQNVLAHPDLIEQAGQLQTTLVNDKDYVATHTSYALNLKGPAVNIQTACSSSLVAIAQAVQSIRSGQCEMAIAGGASITVPMHSGHLYEEGAMLCKDGHCRPFDAAATGTTFSDGVGAVMLKHKEQAIKDGDTIYAVIKGIGVSNDGGGKGSFSAPSAEGQAAAISFAIQDAQLTADRIGYIEAHGTATPLGDPIEIEGLKLAFGEQQAKQYCPIGSVKGNFGHLTIAAGVTGFIKTCLALYHRQLPPSINFSTPNPHIDFTDSPFYVNTTLQPWKAEGVRVAGVSSFGVGGTNAHVILCEATEQPSPSIHSHVRRSQLFCWSAKTESSLNGFNDRMVHYLSDATSIGLQDVAYTLNSTRKSFVHRRFAVASDNKGMIEALKNSASVGAHTKAIKHLPQQLVFMFPGQGDQYINMCKSLYDTESIFREAVNECDVMLQEFLGESILDILYPPADTDVAKEKINQTQYSQPILFTIGYALGKMWMHWGIFPTAMVGHSIGEFVAAYFAGVFSLSDALKLIATRGRMMYQLPKGSMLSVRMPKADVRDYINDTIELAAENSPNLSVLAGTQEAITALSETLKEKDIPCKVIATSHAFHSYMMEEAIAPFEAIVKTIHLQEPLIPIMSTVTGAWMQSKDATDPAYWAKHLRQPVLFDTAIQQLLEASYDAFLEIGPGKSVSTFARQQTIGKSIPVIISIEKEESLLPSDIAITNALGQLWINGIEPDWSAYYQQSTCQRLDSVPTYAFDRKEYWLEARAKESIAMTHAATVQEEEPLLVSTTTTAPIGTQDIVTRIKEIIEGASGIDVSNAAPESGFMELGLDSLSLTQVALMLKKQFAVAVSFRQLNDELHTIALLSNYIASQNAQGERTVQDTGAPKISLTKLSPEEENEIKKPFGAIARIEKKVTTLTPSQQEYLDTLTNNYNQKTKGSKAYTQHHRAHMADPRVVSGFKPGTKELVYSIVANRSKGSRLWDIDGNEYIDALNGFGSNMLGYQPDFLKEALIQQIHTGYEIGPQHVLSGEVCQLICEFTHFDRAALCNTGSEAVLGALRIARTVSGRSLIIAFTGSYHGINDEVIARSSKQHKTYPAAPGIMPESVQNMLFLEYGTEETLRIIEERSEEIAAVLVEPVQSRRCDFQPVTFLKRLRKITERENVILIFDEIISGFRFHPGGVQEMFGIRADLATYGKVIGGGLSVGVIAGKKTYMDALDGGWWQYGDDSVPEVGVTYFAGTFVRHPLALATAKATLQYFKSQGPDLQKELNAKGKLLADSLNHICRKLHVPMYIAQFCSIWRIHYIEEFPYSELLFVLMRYKGIHIVEGFPCFVTAAHQEADLQAIISCFEESILELKQHQLMPYYKHPAPEKGRNINTPPVPHAELGKDVDGNPAWFVPNENQPGSYLQVMGIL